MNVLNEPVQFSEPVSVESNELPYKVGERPMPEGNDLDTLLPQVGSFERVELRTVGSIYGTYRHGESEVFVELGMDAGECSAQEGVATVKRGIDAEFPDERQIFVKSGDVTFFGAANRRRASMAWSRGAYFFSAYAKGGENDLDEFMSAFPY